MNDDLNESINQSICLVWFELNALELRLQVENGVVQAATH